MSLANTLRSLWRHRAFSVTVVLTLALAIGATTSLVSVVDAALLRPLPFPESGRVVNLWQSNPDRGLPRFSVSPPDFLDIEAAARSFEGLAALHRSNMSLTGEDEPIRLRGARVSAGYFHVLRLPMVLGRDFSSGEDEPGSPPVLILSEKLWRSRYGADPQILGRQLRLDGTSRTVIGVAPSTSVFDLEAWIPLVLEHPDEERGAHYLQVLGRLGPGVSVAEARREVQALAARLAGDHPDTNTGWGADVEPLREAVVGDLRPALYALLAAVAAVLLIACLNVAHLLLVRLAERERELAARSALGASRGALVRQLLLESAVLALAAGCLGAALAAWGTPALLALDPDALPRSVHVAVDLRVLGAALAISLATTLVFGLVPAWRSARPDLVEMLKEGGRGQAAGGDRLRRWVVLGEVGLAVALVAGGVLLLGSFDRLAATGAGFEPHSVLAVNLAPAAADYPDPEAIRGLMRRLYERVGVAEASPRLLGAEAVGAISPLPYSGRNTVFAFAMAGQPPPPSGQEPIARIHVVSPGLFRALEIPLLAGRDFELRDDDRAPGAVVVSQAAVRRFWHGADPLGERITFGDGDDPEARWLEVVGVVGDLRSESPGEAVDPVFYLSALDQPFLATALVLRTTGEPSVAVGEARKAIEEVDPQIPVFDVQPMEQMLSATLAQPRFNATLLGLFAGLALVLAATGVYGVTSYSLAQRRREFGIRSALGAEPRALLSWVVALGMTPVLWGLGVGVVLALFAGRLLRGLVFGTGVHDPGVLALAAGLLGLVGLIACWLPARRAARVDPGEALREE